MFENAMQTRAAICGTGLLLGIIFLFAHLPLILLVVPVGILFLGIVADPEETHAVWYGMLNGLGIFDIAELNELEKANYAEKRHYFWFGEVALASILAGIFAVPIGIFLACRGDRARVHRCCDPVPAALRLPAKNNPVGDEGGCRCSDRSVREERAGPENLLGALRGTGRDRAGAGY